MTIDFFSPEFVADPYPGYAQLRSECPVRHIEQPDGLEVYALTRHSDVQRALQDKRISKDPFRAEEQLRAAKAVGLLMPDLSMVRQNLSNTDAPHSDRLRRIVSSAFHTKRIKALEPWIEGLVNQLVDGMIARGSGDLVVDLCRPLPVAVVCRIMGVPLEIDRFMRWVQEGEYPTFVEMLTANQQEMAEDLYGFFAELVERKQAERAAEPDAEPDMIHLMIDAHRAGEMDDGELVGMALTLFHAGAESTANMLGNGMHALLTHPDQLELLRARPELADSAVDELMRFTTSVEKATFRVAKEDLRYSDATIPAGGIVSLVLSSANRDETVFADPDTLDITRDAGAHVAFGFGRHYCMGSLLAKMELRTAYITLLRRCPELRLAVPAEQLQWRINMIQRGLRQLPVHYV